MSHRTHSVSSRRCITFYCSLSYNEVHVKAWFCSVALQESSTAALKRSPSACSPRTRTMILIGRGTVLPPATPSTHPTPGPVLTAVVLSRVSVISAQDQQNDHSWAYSFILQTPVFRKEKNKLHPFFYSCKKRKCTRQSDKSLYNRREWWSHCVCPQELPDSTKKYKFLATFYKSKTCKSNLFIVYPSVFFHYKHVREEKSNLVVLLY